MPWPCAPGPRAALRSAAPGDIMCFDNAHDANGNGRLDDPGSDLGVVIESDDSRLRFVYLSGQRVRTGVLTPAHPHLHRRAGRIVNSYVRAKAPEDAPKTAYLASELASGIITPEAK